MGQNGAGECPHDKSDRRLLALGKAVEEGEIQNVEATRKNQRRMKWLRYGNKDWCPLQVLEVALIPFQRVTLWSVRWYCIQTLLEVLLVMWGMGGVRVSGLWWICKGNLAKMHPEPPFVQGKKWGTGLSLLKGIWWSSDNAYMGWGTHGDRCFGYHDLSHSVFWDYNDCLNENETAQMKRSVLPLQCLLPPASLVMMSFAILKPINWQEDHWDWLL